MPSDPLVLAFDTSAAHCAAALLCGDRVLAEAFESMGRGQAERLMPLLEETLAQAGKPWDALDAIGVGVGPGNFTGIRIAVAAARGLALGLGVPAIGVTSFEALALGSDDPDAVALVPAPQDYAYLGAIRGAAPRRASEAEVVAETRARMVICESLPRGLAAQGVRAMPPTFSMAEAIARVAATRLGAPEARPVPLYLRAADAAPSSDPPPLILP